MSTISAGAQKVVLITGCSAGGIGFALCEEFAARGCVVYATARRLESMEGFQNTNIRKLRLDVTNEDDIERAVQTVLEETGKIDILVNNAGAASIGPVADATIHQLRSTFELNTFGAIRMVNAVIPSMFNRKEGLIINIGSIAGVMTTPWHGVYSAAKAALHFLTESLEMECKPFGVKVMLVAPGGVTSNFSKNHEATFSLSPTSSFRRYEPKMIERLNASQDRGSLDSNKFAQRVVAQALSASPPPYMTLGLWSTRFHLMQWLPRQLVLQQMSRSLL